MNSISFLFYAINTRISIFFRRHSMHARCLLLSISNSSIFISFRIFKHLSSLHLLYYFSIFSSLIFFRRFTLSQRTSLTILLLFLSLLIIFINLFLIFYVFILVFILFSIFNPIIYVIFYILILLSLFSMFNLIIFISFSISTSSFYWN